MSSDRRRIAGLAVLVSLLWTLCFPLLDLGLRHSTPLWFATFRGAAGGMLLLVWGQLTHRRRINLRRDGPRIAGIAILSTTIGYGTMFVGGGLVSVGVATVLANSQPIWAALLAVTFLGERNSSRRWFVLMLAFVGVALLADLRFERAELKLGALLLVLSAVALAAGNLLIKSIADRSDAVMVSGLQLTLGSVPLGIAAWQFEGPFEWPTAPEFWISLIVLAAASSAAGAVLWQWLLARAPLSQLNAVSFLIPVYGLPLMLAYGIPISIWQWLGGGLVVACVCIVLLGSDPDAAEETRLSTSR